MPGGTRDKASGITQLRQKEKDLARYAEKRKAGEQPDGISKDKQERYEKRVAAFERSESRLADDLPAESLESLKKSTFNKQEK